MSQGARKYSVDWRLVREMRGDTGALEFVLGRAPRTSSPPRSSAFLPLNRREPMRVYPRDQACGFRYTREAWGAFSNFQLLPVPIVAGPWSFGTSEAAYRACKFPAHPGVQQRIAEAPTAREAAAIGRTPGLPRKQSPHGRSAIRFRLHPQRKRGRFLRPRSLPIPPGRIAPEELPGPHTSAVAHRSPPLRVPATTSIPCALALSAPIPSFGRRTRSSRSPRPCPERNPRITPYTRADAHSVKNRPMFTRSSSP